MWYSNLTEEFSLVSIQDFGNDRAQAELVECVKFIEFLRFIGFIVFIRWFQSGGRWWCAFDRMRAMSVLTASFYTPTASKHVDIGRVVSSTEWQSTWALALREHDEQHDGQHQEQHWEEKEREELITKILPSPIACNNIISSRWLNRAMVPFRHLCNVSFESGYILVLDILFSFHHSYFVCYCFRLSFVLFWFLMCGFDLIKDTLHGPLDRSIQWTERTVWLNRLGSDFAEGETFSVRLHGNLMTSTLLPIHGERRIDSFERRRSSHPPFPGLKICSIAAKITVDLLHTLLYWFIAQVDNQNNSKIKKTTQNKLRKRKAITSNKTKSNWFV